MRNKKLHRLFIDESGQPQYSHSDKNFTYCGIIANPIQSEYLKIVADQIKFKYWNRTSTVFHSVDIGKKRNDFSILNDQDTYSDFKTDLFKFLNNNSYRCIIVSINKEKARTLGWSELKVRNIATDTLIELYIKFLHEKCFLGQIIAESSSSADINLYKRYTSYLSQGCPSMNLSHIDLKKQLTSITFVSKNNHDIEAQIADILVYAGVKKILSDEGFFSLLPESYEGKLINILNTKLINFKDGTNSFIRLPLP